MKIVKLEPSQHRQGRWLVWLEDGCLVRLGEGEVVSLGLYTGKELSEEEGEALAAAAPQGRMDQRAVELLSPRPMSRKELVDKLSASTRRRRKPAGEDGPEPDPAVGAGAGEALARRAARPPDRMEELGLLSDEQYAGAVVRHYAAKGYGPRKLRDELYRRGVPRQFWEEALEQCPAQTDQLAQLVARRMRGLEPSRENLKKTSDYLARRGFSWEEIAGALERYQWETEE